MTDSTNKPEPNDHHVYSMVMFYLEMLSVESSEIEADPHLHAFLNAQFRQESGIKAESEKAERCLKWLEEIADQNQGGYDVTMSISHGTVRYIKSTGLLYLGFLKQRRNLLSMNPNVTSMLLSAMDRKISKQEEAYQTQGVFANASLLPLLVDQELPEIYSESVVETVSAADIIDASVVRAKRPRPVMIKTIEILDDELRDRCLDLFNKFEKDGEPHRHDTVVTEATRILENRLRLMTKSTGAETGADLAAKAFSPKTGMLKVSDIYAEQEGAFFLARGIFGLIRNGTSHKLSADLMPQRVVQILGLIDYLIYVANSGVPVEGKSEEGTASAQQG
jgi:hypothetical protein